MLGEMKSFMGLGGGLIGKILVWKDGLEKKTKKHRRPKQARQEEKEWIFPDINASLGSCFNARYHPCVKKSFGAQQEEARWSGKKALPFSSNWKTNSAPEHDKPRAPACLL